MLVTVRSTICQEYCYKRWELHYTSCTRPCVTVHCYHNHLSLSLSLSLSLCRWKQPLKVALCSSERKPSWYSGTWWLNTRVMTDIHYQWVIAIHILLYSKIPHSYTHYYKCSNIVQQYLFPSAVVVYRVRKLVLPPFISHWLPWWWTQWTSYSGERERTLTDKHHPLTWKQPPLSWEVDQTIPVQQEEEEGRKCQ